MRVKLSVCQSMHIERGGRHQQSDRIILPEALVLLELLRAEGLKSTCLRVLMATGQKEELGLCADGAWQTEYVQQQCSGRR